MAPISCRTSPRRLPSRWRSRAFSMMASETAPCSIRQASRDFTATAMRGLFYLSPGRNVRGSCIAELAPVQVLALGGVDGQTFRVQQQRLLGGRIRFQDAVVGVELPTGESVGPAGFEERGEPRVLRQLDRDQAARRLQTGRGRASFDVGAEQDI